MCLIRVYGAPLPPPGIGYKVLMRLPFGPQKSYTSPFSPTHLILGVWHEEHRSNWYGAMLGYALGLHCYAKREDALGLLQFIASGFREIDSNRAESLVLARVRYRNVVAHGLENNRDDGPYVIVAREIMVEAEENGNEKQSSGDGGQDPGDQATP